MKTEFIKIPRCVFAFVCVLLATSFGVAGGGVEASGPTFHLVSGAKDSAVNPVSDLMYFVALISPAPVTSVTSPGCTQAARLISSRRRVSGSTFTATCEIELEGDGRQRSVFDLAPAILRHDRQLQNGGTLKHQLKSIDVRGAGIITAEITGTISNGVNAVGEVRFRFNPKAHASPVWIELCDIQRVDGCIRPFNEMVARVNSLTFRRQEGPPKMEISVASVKHKEAGDGFWQNFRGGLTGLAVNMMMDPLPIEPAGHLAMLDFGQALASGAPEFTFPYARNLRTEIAESSN